jgi:hypothetical protein
MAEVVRKNGSLLAEEPPLTREIVKSGALAGIVGGILMAVWAMIATSALGLGPLVVPQLIGATFQGPEALVRGAGTVALGLVVHLLVSAGFGVLFATLVRRDTPLGVGMLAGVAYAMALFVLMTFIVVPVVNPVMSNRVSMMVGTTLIMHLLYGIGVGLTPLIRRGLADIRPGGRTPRYPAAAAR